MRIGSEKKLDRVGKGHAKQTRQPGGMFRVSDPGATPGVISTPMTQSVDNINVLLAAQEQDSIQQNRRATVKRGRNMLDLLDQVKIGYLDGRVAPQTLRQLGALSRQSIDQISNSEIDGPLNHVMQSIELRAEVELAKMAKQKNK